MYISETEFYKIDIRYIFIDMSRYFYYIVNSQCIHFVLYNHRARGKAFSLALCI